MLKKILLASIMVVGSTAAFADQDTGCGAGTTIWAGKSGPGFKILAVTTNGIFANQLFGITFGTLGCKGTGTITAQAVTFTNENAETLARDMSVGEGESLNVLAELLNIKSQDKSHFFTVSKQNFSHIYSSQNKDAYQVLASLQTVMANDDVLKAYI